MTATPDAEVRRTDADVADPQVHEADVRPELGELHRVVLAVHLQVHEVFDGLDGVGPSGHADGPAGAVCGAEERETVHVVPVRMGDEQHDGRLLLGRHQPLAETTDTGARIDDQLAAVREPHLDTRGVPTVAYCLGTRRGHRPPGAPQRYKHAFTSPVTR